MRFIGALVCVVGATASAWAADLTGDWEFTAKVLNDFSYVRATIKSDGATLSGTAGDNRLQGTSNGNDVAFKLTRPSGESAGEFKGVLSGSELKGSAVWPGLSGEVTWTAKRAAIRPATPRLHQFEPTEFHRVFSDAIAPVLRISAGDTVKTWTVDAAGVDSQGVRRSQGGNPETGPF